MKKAFFGFIAGFMLCAVGTQATAQAFQVDPLDAAIREASTYLNGKIPKGNKTVFLNITSNYPDLSEYILSLLSENAVNDKIFSVVDRGLIDSIRAELSFQMSGDVDDSSAQSIGKMLGAQSIVSGAVSKIGSVYRLQVKAIEVQTAEVKGQWSKNFPGGSPTIAALTATQSVPAKSGSVTATASSGETTQAAATETKTYKIGDTGPAGGLVFYDKGNNAEGWRYLEVASKDAGTAQWGAYGHDLTGTDTKEGTGKHNTDIIMYYLRGAGESGKAAQLARQYTQGGYTDWFLPSKDELNLIYTNLRLKMLGDYSMSYYWSSSQIDNRNAWCQRFSDGLQDYYYYPNSKNDTYNVRAVRCF
jgi:hypothetical protein